VSVYCLVQGFGWRQDNCILANGQGDVHTRQLCLSHQQSLIKD